MKIILRALLAIMLLGVLIGQSTFAQTAGPQRSGYANFGASSYDGATGVEVGVQANLNDYSSFAVWYQASYFTGEFYACYAAGYLPPELRPKLTVSPNGSVTVRFTPMFGMNCPFSEIVLECRATDATRVTITETNSTTKGGSGTSHSTGYNVSMPECVLPGVGADYVANYAWATSARTISTGKP